MKKGEFARKLAYLRENKGWTQSQLADRLGVARETVHRWETGKHGAPQSKIELICKLFDITEAEFWDPHYPSEYMETEGPIEIIDPIPAPYLDTETDSNLRAIRCPRCQSTEFSSHASFCGDCGSPLYNLCTKDPSHINRPNARRCETCGVRTWWSLCEERFADLLSLLEIDSVHKNGEG